MREKARRVFSELLALMLIISTAIVGFDSKVFAAADSDSSILLQKISKSYTKKFCNAIGFGLSKESAMKFSIEENKQSFKKKKGINNIDKDLLAEEIANSVIEECGYPINLSGEKGVQEFKNYYLSTDK